MSAVKSGIILKAIGERVFECKGNRDDFMHTKLKEGFFCYPFFRPWPKEEYLLLWFAEAHTHHDFCGGILMAADIAADQRHLENATEAEVYMHVATLLMAGVSVSFTYLNGDFHAQTYMIKDWRKLAWAKGE